MGYAGNHDRRQTDLVTQERLSREAKAWAERLLKIHIGDRVGMEIGSLLGDVYEDRTFRVTEVFPGVEKCNLASDDNGRSCLVYGYSLRDLKPIPVVLATPTECPMP